MLNKLIALVKITASRLLPLASSVAYPLAAGLAQAKQVQNRNIDDFLKNFRQDFDNKMGFL